MSTELYFSYGSNMSLRRIRTRVATAQPLGSAVLQDHRLAFHKISIDGSGKCDIAESAGSVVEGVVFELGPPGLEGLDRYEGRGYKRIRIAVMMQSGETVDACTYKAVRTCSGLKPYSWYLEHVIQGAREAGLSQSYIDGLRNVSSVHDTNTGRARRELRIYD